MVVTKAAGVERTGFAGAQEPVHPGTITFIDGNTGKVVAQRDARTMSTETCFAETEHGRVPVVRVVAYLSGNMRLLKEYGSDGDLLRVTRQVR